MCSPIIDEPCEELRATQPWSNSNSERGAPLATSKTAQQNSAPNVAPTSTVSSEFTQFSVDLGN
ncbi:hypothetical protein CVT25_004150 [Psilocybe cyanescens]|uniref:Uncharacterized protein n=1 Tax=Psilocybe cyanescens TaxID=93625 RepID=A0A409XKT0_PSICY|nr:hypothetical protein CVT25_004150 [Psilocybe cyanescens]